MIQNFDHNIMNFEEPFINEFLLSFDTSRINLLLPKESVCCFILIFKNHLVDRIIRIGTSIIWANIINISLKSSGESKGSLSLVLFNFLGQRNHYFLGSHVCLESLLQCLGTHLLLVQCPLHIWLKLFGLSKWIQ